MSRGNVIRPKKQYSPQFDDLVGFLKQQYLSFSKSHHEALFTTCHIIYELPH